MKHSLIVLFAALFMIGLPKQTFSRDDRLMFPIDEALATLAAQNKIQGIDLYFGNQEHPKILQDFGEFRTNQKTNALNKSDKQACEWVFLSALLKLQERASSLGANAVINIKSNYRNNEVVSETEYQCGAGHIFAGVALKGRIVKLSK
jgi:uncharacterized protein YbjQ (UPF0145 family)